MFRGSMDEKVHPPILEQFWAHTEWFSGDHVEDSPRCPNHYLLAHFQSALVVPYICTADAGVTQHIKVITKCYDNLLNLHDQIK